MSFSKAHVRKAGLHYCCYILSCQGWDVDLAERNHRGVDIVASHGKGDLVEIRVKTLGNAAAVPLGPSLDHIHVDLWMIVTGLASPTPAIYMLWPAEVERPAKLQTANGRLQFWLEREDYDHPDRHDAWERVEKAAAARARQLSHSGNAA